MNTVLKTLLLGFSLIVQTEISAKEPVQNIQQVKIGGYIGKRITDCINHRVITQDTKEITDVFAHQDEVHNLWGTEFWGKWVQGAIASYQYMPSEKLYNLISQSADAMINHQLADGYIGNYDKEHQLKGWDVWGRKYTTLGLLKWYKLSGDKKALKAACRLIDYTMTQLGKGKKRIVNTGNYKGMASSSILEPVMLLYNITQQTKYLEFARWIVADWELDGGPQLIAKADTPVCNRWPVLSDKWWEQSNGQKAYEMMSCYVGLLELAKVDNRLDYVSVVEKVVKHIEEEEINICGSGASSECWYNGFKRQTIPAVHMMETCVGFTWMQINERLWQITHNPHYADNIEHTFYNAILASMKDDASQIVKYTPLEGHRVEGENQCNLHINCCNANGPRAFAMIPRMAYQLDETQQRLFVNIYSPASMHAQINRSHVVVEQTTNYPQDGKVTIKVHALPESQFTLSLRIPAWSKNPQVSVNGEALSSIKEGGYLDINRRWTKDDEVTLDLGIEARVAELNHMYAVQWGPIILARDTRFKDGYIDECITFKNNEQNKILIHPITSHLNIWMAFEAQVKLGSYRENSTVKLCDFASAGSDWNPTERYRVWLPKTIYAIKEPR